MWVYSNVYCQGILPGNSGDRWLAKKERQMRKQVILVWY